MAIKSLLYYWLHQKSAGMGLSTLSLSKCEGVNAKGAGFDGTQPAWS